MKAAVCVCTFRRPESLDRLLRSLEGQRFDGDPPEVELVVVDNDADGSARPVVERWADRIGWPVRYAVEPRRGIPPARNRALAEAPDDADVVAMLDDDERADPLWLASLLEGFERHGADVVAGTRLPLYPEGVPAWIARADLFRGPRTPSGLEVRIAYTYSVAFRSSILNEMERRFDERLNWTGTSDTDFFYRVRKLGKRIVSMDEAVVLEPVPPHRASARWILRRFFRFGTTSGWLQRSPDNTLWERIRRAARGLGRTAASPLRLARLPYEGRGALVRFAADWAFTAGFLYGWAGFFFEEYRHHRYPETADGGEGV